jgi:hypothetical protein
MRIDGAQSSFRSVCCVLHPEVIVSFTPLECMFSFTLLHLSSRLLDSYDLVFILHVSNHSPPFISHQLVFLCDNTHQKYSPSLPYYAPLEY